MMKFTLHLCVELKVFEDLPTVVRINFRRGEVDQDVVYVTMHIFPAYFSGCQ